MDDDDDDDDDDAAADDDDGEEAPRHLGASLPRLAGLRKQMDRLVPP